MKQYEAVIQVMEKNGGYATLGELYREVLDLRGVKWGTKTPDANIRRIVQVHDDKFFRIRPGLWALSEWKDRLPEGLRVAAKRSKGDKEKKRAFDHSYYQGLLVEIGNIQRFGTYVPPQDKNKLFLRRKRLGGLTNCAKMHRFSYDSMIRSATTVDVVWFNDRRMPAALFEVEYSPVMTNSLIKFNELRDFRTEMYIVAHEKHRRKFEDRCDLNTFKAIRKYVKFLSYERIGKDHTLVCRLDAFGSGIQGIYASS